MKKTICMFMSVVLLLLSFLLSACAQEPAATTEATETKSSRWLDISAEVVPENPKPTTELTVPGTDRTISHKGLINPKILIDGTYVPLAEAVEKGQLTPELVIYYAMMDAVEGKCKESYYTENGLTQFVYVYGDYYVWVVRDVFQTPAKGDHMIKEVLIADYIQIDNLSNSGFVDKNGKSLGSEDWGLKIEVAEVTPTGMTLKITQSGGQHMGQLCIVSYSIAPYEWEGDWWGRETGDYSFDKTRKERMIENDAVTEMHISWEPLEGSLPSGKYEIRLHIYDDFSGKKHPLTRDYTDMQVYFLEEVVVP